MNDYRIEIGFSPDEFREGIKKLLKCKHHIQDLIKEATSQLNTLERTEKDAYLRFLDKEDEQNRTVVYIPQHLLKGGV